MSYDPEDDPTMGCPWSGCRCTHVGCLAGWIDRIDLDDEGRETEVTSPCPTCRPEVADHLRRGKGSLMRRRSTLPALPRPSRINSSQDDAA